MSENETVAASEESRGKYTADQLRDLLRDGKALPDANGEPSYPIADEEDLKAAIPAVGDNKTRAYVVRRAKALGLVELLPENWTDEGTIEEVHVDIEQQNTERDPSVERRERVARDLDGTYETRQFAASGLEVRETSDGGVRFSGYASTTESPYEVADFTETIARGAFKRTLGEEPDVVLLVNHTGMPLARTKSGTLTLSEDARGLRVDADLDPSDPDVQSLLPKMRRGDLSEMSFAFRATDQDWNDDYTNRLIRSVSIHRGDVSIVTMGANPTTSSSVTFREAEEALVELRAGKAISKAREEQIKLLAEQSKQVADELEGLLPQVDEPAADPEGVASIEFNMQDMPDLTVRAQQDLDLLRLRGAR